jgi:hypothetical protein
VTWRLTRRPKPDHGGHREATETDLWWSSNVAHSSLNDRDVVLVVNLHEAQVPVFARHQWGNSNFLNPVKQLLLNTLTLVGFSLALPGCTGPASLWPATVSFQQVTPIPEGRLAVAAPSPSQSIDSGVAAPPTRGIPFGPWTVPPDMIGPLYNGGVLTGRAPYQQLDEVRARKGHVVLYLARKKSQDEYGMISVSAARQFLQTWPDISPYIKDGTVWGIIVSDDITGKHIWGPDAPYYPQIDSIAQLVTERWPEARTIVRAPPTSMVYPWKWVRWAWAQYTNAPRNGEVTVFRDRQLAKADSLGLCLVFGLNIVNGGDGSSGIGERRRYRMSAPEILKYYSALLPHTPVAFHWEYRPDVEADPAIHAAMVQVRAWADTTPPPVCRHN